MSINREKHVWEGWTVGDFIDDIEPIFDIVNSSNAKNWDFPDKKALKSWIKDNQPYYKKHIPDVYKYFLNKTNLK
jgi:hypothetical protein